MSDPTTPRKRHDPKAGSKYFAEWRNKLKSKGDLQRAISFRLRANERDLGLREEPVPFLVSILEVSEHVARALLDPGRAQEPLELRHGQWERAVRWIYGNTTEQEFLARGLLRPIEDQAKSPDKTS